MPKTIGIVWVAAVATRARHRPRRRDHAHLPTDQIGRHFRKPIDPAFGKMILDRHVLAFDVAGFGQSPAKCVDEMPARSERLRIEHPDHLHRWLLRARRERPRDCCAAERG